MRHTDSVRWELLFDDLEARLAAEAVLELASEVADRTRRERARVPLLARLIAARHTQITVWVAGFGRCPARVGDVGADWVLLGLPGGPEERNVLVPFAAIRSVSGLHARTGPVSAVAKGFTVGAALRAISRDRATVSIVDLEGQRITGTIDAVGQDALDLAEHPVDLPRRPENVLDVRTVPFGAIAAVVRE